MDEAKFVNEDSSDIEITEIRRMGKNTIYVLKGIKSDTISVFNEKK